ncbi:RagB/SusD family nutrient uptake outer membrane protein [Plebeiibacterium marinum]|uniref:RagB/SusD family nutrient uptake outer membrane protein n=1 Tax=Plebeiibacterium marinum TaxID=2992111 RepID=A0AAE3MG27_9BACT|nr:RagB/SusD family nutrient uptake outer membrane protein [Plebeiobacterium marinum]MCW3806931.1 RagB/SusD family nutrient uptake outer membrane protein [Plebeiobacterium marinum]
MKKIKYLIILFSIVCLNSCEDDFLEEKPQDFFSAENSFVTNDDFDASINNLYGLTRREFFDRDENHPFDYLYGTDIVFDGEPQQSANRHSPMRTAYDPTGRIAKDHWGLLYKIVAESNTVIDRITDTELDEANKAAYKAKALFFRGLAYRTLAYLYGGVPLILNEIKTPKDDFVRASKADVLNQVIKDLTEAANNLPSITNVNDGEIHNLAAYHLLSEVYISVGKYQDAVDAATLVIDNPNTALMKDRFGSRTSETDKDVYWDLFRVNNQNRKSGNTEGIWIIQFETDVSGGNLLSTSRRGFMLERHHGPFVRDLKIGDDKPFSWPVGDYSGGRGIGWAISTEYFSNTIWESDFDNDMRNANHNFVREFISTKSSSSHYGKIVSTEDPALADKVPSRQFYAYQSKCTTPYNHPENVYSNTETYSLKGVAGSTYTDQYMFRLAETYLLRAEAYLGLSQTTEAAANINEVRSRANANPVSPENVNIEYILDERMRELGVEEKRRLTLMRLGKLYDRIQKCNPFYRDMTDGMTETYNLWPIPASEIEANIGAVLEQNPGYN